MHSLRVYKNVMHPLRYTRTIYSRLISTCARVSDIKVFNSLTKTKESLLHDTFDVKKDSIKWYTCGPTVYDSSHIGHARTYVSLDLVRRVLNNDFNAKVDFVMNVTDVDDKIIARAQESNVSVEELTCKYEKEFQDDMLALDVLPPLSYERVSKHIHNIINYIQAIINNGYAYESDGDVYFDIHAFTKSGHKYGKLAPANRDLLSTETDENNKKKYNNHFALWKKAKESEGGFYWDSPWGKGRPGWHVECSSINNAIFGNHIHIHSGGIDLSFPHHTNEIAQCEAYQNNISHQWCDIFMHTGHLHIAGRKMSKSLKNFITIQDYLQYGPLSFDYAKGSSTMMNKNIDTDIKDHSSAFRFFCMAHRYHSNIQFSNESIERALSIKSQIENCFHSIKHISNHCIQTTSDNNDSIVLLDALENTKKCIYEYYCDDFDFPSVLEEFMKLTTSMNIYIKNAMECGKADLVAIETVYVYMSTFLTNLGFNFHDSHENNNNSNNNQNTSDIINAFVIFRQNIRMQALDVLKNKNSSDDAKNMAKETLKICDNVRDDVFPSLKLELRDFPNAPSEWK